MALRMTEDEYRDFLRRRQDGEPRAGAPAKKRAKYGNRRVSYAGRTFDSQHEADVYRDLELLQRAGEVRAIACQAAFMLPGGVQYVADFIVFRADGAVAVLDAKSPATEQDKVYRLKRRLMRESLGIEIEEV